MISTNETQTSQPTTTVSTFSLYAEASKNRISQLLSTYSQIRFLFTSNGLQGLSQDYFFL